MNFAVDTIGDVKILRLKENRLDTHIASDLKAQLLALLDGEEQRVLLDLAETEYADSSGLGALLLGVRQARESGGRFCIFGARNRVKSLINIAHLEDVVRNFADEQAAIDAISSDD
jgi:anti-sigma B factor antagonist